MLLRGSTFHGLGPVSAPQAGPFHAQLDHTSCTGRKKAAPLQRCGLSAHCWAVGRCGGWRPYDDVAATTLTKDCWAPRGRFALGADRPRYRSRSTCHIASLAVMSGLAASTARIAWSVWPIWSKPFWRASARAWAMMRARSRPGRRAPQRAPDLGAAAP